MRVDSVDGIEGGINVSAPQRYPTNSGLKAVAQRVHEVNMNKLQQETEGLREHLNTAPTQQKQRMEGYYRSESSHFDQNLATIGETDTIMKLRAQYLQEKS
jgi:hypothetical protein